MFVQFIEGSVTDAAALRDRLERWREECGPGATGWLGTTAGVSADGTAFISARFDSPEAARANSDRPEQSAWWAQTERCFTGHVTFTDCEDVALFRGGGSDEAGFVQVIRGQVSDVEAARDLFLGDLPEDARPDVIGGLVGTRPDGSYTTVVYFSSEAEARAGEAEEDDDEFQEQFEALHLAPPRYLDLAEPWLWSA